MLLLFKSTSCFLFVVIVPLQASKESFTFLKGIYLSLLNVLNTCT